MAQDRPGRSHDEVQRREWLESLESVVHSDGADKASGILDQISQRASELGVQQPSTVSTPYVNTIPVERQPEYPGDLELEERITALIRWNAMAMVVKANKEESGIGGHISTYASAATLYEVGFNHFFRGRDNPHGSDLVYFQGHATPGIYARAFLEGRLEKERICHFRRELMDPPGVSSYPHPWLMPDFWSFPTVSMGLGPIMSIYHARFIKYLEGRGLKEPDDRKVWAFLGDGETDEPESLGSISLAAREGLDNLIFVINCNLQRLDGPVRGSGKVIQELESVFRGAGWNVVKVIWGSDWDPLFEKDTSGALRRRVQELVDGQYQKYAVESGSYVRKDFFGKSPELEKLVRELSDEQIKKLKRGGHDPEKVYAAYKAAVEHRGQPTVILAQTIKGYGMGSAGEGMNIAHQQKKLNEEQLKAFRGRFSVPLPDEVVEQAPLYCPDENSPEIEYLHKRREALGGPIPHRKGFQSKITLPEKSIFDEFFQGTGDRAVSTTMAYVRMLAKVLKDKNIGKLIVPIVPDEARTFGMDALFRQFGIYARFGQKYEPVDRENLLYYKETTNGQILEEGITEAGSLSTFVAAGTAYSNHGIPTIPFFTFYSMFGMQRVGDLVWAAGDSRCKGFLVGGTAGRTTLPGEGLQHQDGNSHLFAMAIPNMKAYDPAFAYEIAVIIQDGLQRMYVDGEDVFYYITVMNDNYRQPAMPEGVEEGIIRGMYRYASTAEKGGQVQANLLGSGAILPETIEAQRILKEDYGIPTDVWSVTSYKELYRDAISVDRWNRLHPGSETRAPYVMECLSGKDVPSIASLDYVKSLALSVARWVPGGMVVLGTDGFGRSEGRAALRKFFEVGTADIVVATLSELSRRGAVESKTVESAIKKFGIDPDVPEAVVR